MKKHVLEGITLVVLAAICAIAANALASRERKMALVGYYPSATKVSKETPEPAPIVAPPVTTTTASAPAAVATATTVVPLPAPTTTTVAPQKIAAPKPAVPTTTAPPPAAKPAPSTAQFAPHPDKAYVEIPWSDVKSLHDAGVLFLDARRTSMYEQGHIAGARSFSVWESDVDDKVKKLFDERPEPSQQNLPIVIYCSGGECEDSHMLAQKLWGIQFNNVYVYKDGYPDWVAHHGEVHTGANP